MNGERKRRNYIPLLLAITWTVIGLVLFLNFRESRHTGVIESEEAPVGNTAQNDASVAETVEVSPETADPVSIEEPVLEPVAVDEPMSDPKIIVWKSERRLDLYDGDEVVKSYRIGLGFAPEGDKEKEGDGRTPEGEYYICQKNPNSNYHLSIGMSYPNVKDATGGIRRGTITQDEHDRIAYAIESKRQPLWNTALGGEIFIHGSGSQSDWTLGCIALDNEDIEELYEVIPVGTVVVVNP